MATLRLANYDPFTGLDEFVQRDVPLAPHTWYRLGGPATYFVQPRSIEELQLAAQRCNDAQIPIYVLGMGANLLVSDAGVSGAVFKLDHEQWRTARIVGQQVDVGAGVDIQKLVLKTCRAALTGIECLAGIPGTIGGAVRMNAGGKFGDIGAVVSKVTVMDREGTIFERHKDDLLFEYRSTNIVAHPGATADDVLRLIKMVQEKVAQQTGITLQSEIKIWA